MQYWLFLDLFYFMIPKKFPLVLKICPLLQVRISKNICKNTKPCEFTCVKNKELLALFLQQILRTLKMLKLQKPKNIQSLRWILLVLIKKKCMVTYGNLWSPMVPRIVPYEPVWFHIVPYASVCSSHYFQVWGTCLVWVF